MFPKYPFDVIAMKNGAKFTYMAFLHVHIAQKNSSFALNSLTIGKKVLHQHYTHSFATFMTLGCYNYNLMIHLGIEELSGL